MNAVWQPYLDAFRAVGIPYPEIALLSVFFICLAVVLWWVLVYWGEQDEAS